MTLKERIEFLPLSAVEVGFPSEDQYFEEAVGDCVVRFTHEYQPYYGACYVAEIRGTELGYREALNLISETIGINPCQLNNKKPRKVIWQSTATGIPEGTIIRQLGRAKIDEFYEDHALNQIQRNIVEQMLTLATWFMLEGGHEIERKYLQELMKDLELIDQKNVLSTLHFINMAYVRSVSTYAVKPG